MDVPRDRSTHEWRRRARGAERVLSRVCRFQHLRARERRSPGALALGSRPACDGHERQAVTGDEGLRGISEQVEDVPLARAQEQSSTVGQQTEITGIVQRVCEPPAEVVAEGVHQLTQGRRRKPSTPKRGKRDQFEHVDRRVAAFRESARACPPRRDRGQKNSTRVPPLQLPRRQAREPRDFARAVARLEPHAVLPDGNRLATPFVALTPSRSLRVTPPASCVDQVTVTRL